MTSHTNFPAIASAFRVGQISLDELLSALRTITVHARRPLRPGLFVVDLGERGRWTFVFTTLDALARHRTAADAAGSIDYFLTTGADLLDNLLPSDVGLFVDADDQHSLALPSSWLAQARSDVDGQSGSVQ